MNIRECLKSDAKAICDIYNYYIEHTVVTFEEEPVSEAIIFQRIKYYTKEYPWLVIENSNCDVVGYAYAAKWAERSAYKKTTEITVYLDHAESGKGYGSELYRAMLSTLSSSGVHVVVAAIALPNKASVKLHESFGFSKVAHFKEVGRKFNSWVDVGYWQIILTNE
ncbi:Phosphinothricin N-acetyltransferase [Moritella sp. JT01]|uniref:GNAT family N-acetyltransferase n=1 Tax=Moritella sp. JT01 TaxID=756698 RepID=UPI000795707B|nr:GNAT family N-acetyltransferase [Moritella sp. JT01]KXO09179.1 Phosphinothricin N-acetyltransferase [Moritella sp. JT01]